MYLYVCTGSVEHTLVMTALFQWVLSWSGLGLAGSAESPSGKKRFSSVYVTTNVQK